MDSKFNNWIKEEKNLTSLDIMRLNTYEYNNLIAEYRQKIGKLPTLQNLINGEIRNLPKYVKGENPFSSGYLRLSEETAIVVRSIESNDKVFLYFFNEGIYTEYKLNGKVEDTFICLQSLWYCNYSVRDEVHKVTLLLPIGCNPDNFSSVSLPPIIGITRVNRYILKEVISTLKPGDTYNEMVKRYNWIIDYKENLNHDLATHNLPAKFFVKYPIYNPYKEVLETNCNVSSFIFKIGRPVFEREPENSNRKTFDFLKIRVTIPSKESFPDRKKFVKTYLKEIVSIVLEKVSSLQAYQRFGIPINFLKLTRAGILTGDELELVFELKDIDLSKEELLKTDLFK